MSIKIEVSSTAIKTKSGVSTRTNKPYSIREQEAYAYSVDRDGNPHKYPQQIKITLGDDQAPYTPGNYTIAPESFFVDRFGSLSLGLILKPLVAQTARAA